jgi:hypothetical protein
VRRRKPDVLYPRRQVELLLEDADFEREITKSAIATSSPSASSLTHDGSMGRSKKEGVAPLLEPHRQAAVRSEAKKKLHAEAIGQRADL